MADGAMVVVGDDPPLRRRRTLSDVKDVIKLIEYVNMGKSTEVAYQGNGRALPRQIMFRIIYGSGVIYDRRTKGALACTCRAFRQWFVPGIMVLRSLGVQLSFIAAANLPPDHPAIVEAKARREAKEAAEHEAYLATIRGPEEGFVAYLQENGHILCNDGRNYASADTIRMHILRTFYKLDSNCTVVVVTDEAIPAFCMTSRGEAFTRPAKAGYALFVSTNPAGFDRIGVTHEELDVACTGIDTMWDNVTYLRSAQGSGHPVHDFFTSIGVIIHQGAMGIVYMFYLDTVEGWPPVRAPARHEIIFR